MNTNAAEIHIDRVRSELEDLLISGHSDDVAEVCDQLLDMATSFMSRLLKGETGIDIADLAAFYEGRD